MFFQADTTINAVATQVTVSGIVVAAIQYLKSSKLFPWITAKTATLNRILSMAAAVATSVGVHITWNHGSLPGSYMVAVTGMTIMGILTGAFDVLKSLVFQEIIYRSTKTVPPVPVAASTGKPVESSLKP
jgi:hypothetical protein